MTLEDQTATDQRKTVVFWKEHEVGGQKTWVQVSHSSSYWLCNFGKSCNLTVP